MVKKDEVPVKILYIQTIHLKTFYLFACPLPPSFLEKKLVMVGDLETYES